MTVSDESRVRIRAAMAQLLKEYNGPPQAKPKWKRVVEIADVSLATANRATDLREEWKRSIEERRSNPKLQTPTAPSPALKPTAEQNAHELRYSLGVMANQIQALSLLARKNKQTIDEQLKELAEKDALVAALRMELKLVQRSA